MSLKKNLLYNFLLSFSQVAFPLLSIPYISRVLDPQGIGKVGFIDSLSYYFIVIAEFGITAYAIREISRKKEDKEALGKLVSELLLLHLITSVVSTIIYIVAAIILYNKINDIRLVLFSLTFLLINSLACEWYFWGTERFKYITLRSLFVRVLGLVSIFLLVATPADYALYYAITVVSALLIILSNYIRMIAEVAISFKHLQWRGHLKFVRISYAISLLYGVVIMLDAVVLQIISTSAAVAYYMFSAKTVRLAAALITDTLLVFYPRTVSLFLKNDKDALQQTIIRSSQLIMITTIPMAVGILLLADRFVKVYFGDSFAPLATDLKILCLYPFLKASSLFLNKQILMPLDNEKQVLKGLFIGAVVFIALAIPLSYLYADRGTSTAIIVSELCVLIANWHYIKQMGLQIKIVDGKTAFQALASSVWFLPVIYFIGVTVYNPVLQLAVIIIICFFTYFACLLFIFKTEMVVALFHSFKSRVPGFKAYRSDE